MMPSLRAHTKQRPDAAATVTEPKLSLTVTHREDMRLLSAARNRTAEATVDEFIRTTFELDSFWVCTHVASEAHTSHVDLSVGVKCLHICTPDSFLLEKRAKFSRFSERILE